MGWWMNSDSDLEDGPVLERRGGGLVVERRGGGHVPEENHKPLITRLPESPPSLPEQNGTIEQKFDYIAYFIFKESRENIHDIYLSTENVKIMPKDANELVEIDIVLNKNSHQMHVTKTWRHPDLLNGDLTTSVLSTNNYNECIAWINFSLSTGTRHREGYIPPARNTRVRPSTAPTGRSFTAMAPTLSLLDRLVDVTYERACKEWDSY